MFLDIEVYKGDDNIFVASCPELDLHSHASTRDEAVDKLKFNILDYIKNSRLYKEAREDIDFSVRFYSSRFPCTH
jgi:predicted RNase H-like HicB family nuclease